MGITTLGLSASAAWSAGASLFAHISSPVSELEVDKYREDVNPCDAIIVPVLVGGSAWEDCIKVCAQKTWKKRKANLSDGKIGGRQRTLGGFNQKTDYGSVIEYHKFNRMGWSAIAIWLFFAYSRGSLYYDKVGDQDHSPTA